MATSKNRLGRGLGALISGGVGKPAAANPKKAASASPAAAPRAGAARKAPSSPAGKTASPAAEAEKALGYREIKVADIRPNPYQPRREFSSESLKELADSIRSEGLLQPVIVRLTGDTYQLIAGERRWRAFQLLKLAQIPARVVEAGDATSAAMALIENLQRADLNPVEEARGYASLMRDFDLTQDAVAGRVGKGRATIANALRLLNLPEEVQGFLASGLLSSGHAKALLGVENDRERVLLARRILEEGLSVRAAEKLVQDARSGRATSRSNGRTRPLSASEQAAVQDIEKKVASFFNSRVSLQHTSRRGKLIIEYRGNEDLQRILEKLGLSL
ncbi:MAG: ParB/RepB/Spo0J family partition protein [Puniceicoccaceae bacterium]|nr:MAG: ParB/RepB/Spo0J family partition protein [Puniceicoccaceae bacterium]